jgi:hypothetical protein
VFGVTMTVKKSVTGWTDSLALLSSLVRTKGTAMPDMFSQIVHTFLEATNQFEILQVLLSHALR